MSNKKERKGSTASATTTYEFQFPQPKEKVSCKHLIYNPKDGTIFRRTASSWFKIILFYLIFYAVLAALFAISMQALFATLDEHEPKWKIDSTIVGANPGLAYRPLSEDTERGSVIQFNTKKPEDSKFWKDLLDDFLSLYLDNKKLPNEGTNQKICDFDTNIASNEVCAVDVERFGNCAPEQSYGYLNASPCIFLKLNKIFDWVPECYYDIHDLPAEMPDDLKNHIRSLPPSERKQVWLSCSGEYDYDNENIGPIEYIPHRGFPSYYYPYKNVPGYLSPLLAVRFTNPKLNEMISIECRVWAKNIIYSGSLRDRKGSVSFQLLLD